MLQIFLLVKNYLVSETLFTFFTAKIQFRMGDNEKVEAVDDEVLSVNSDDYVPEGCQKLYSLNDGPSKQYITMDDGSKILTFRANRKPVEKYYETIKSKIISTILLCITYA